MSTRSVRARLTPVYASETFSEAARTMWVEFNSWYKAYPEATFDEIDSYLGEQGRGLLGMALELILRQGDLGATPKGAAVSNAERRWSSRAIQKRQSTG